MDKQTLIRDMKQACKSSFITRNGLAQYMGIKNPQNVDQYLYAVSYTHLDVYKRQMIDRRFVYLFFYGSEGSMSRSAVIRGK